MNKMPEYIVWLRCEHCGKKYDAADGYCCDPDMCEVCGQEVATEDYNGCECCLDCFETLKEAANE
jgi:hypothetical protein